MKQVLRESVWWESVRTGLWTVPLGMLALAVLLHAGALALDEGGHDLRLLRAWWMYSGSGEDAQNLLSTLATSIMTMASVVFSITVVTLTLASNQYGSRIVRTYMRDVRTKLALGAFTSTIVYCLLALRSVHRDMGPETVPHVTVSIGLLLGLLCVMALLFFMHLVARSIVADQVIRRVSRELEEQIDELPSSAPARTPADRVAPAWPGDFEEHGVLLRSTHEGYVQAVDHESVAAAAAHHDVHVSLDFKPGEFMCAQGWLGRVHPAARATAEVQDALRDAIVIGDRRTATQDLEFSIRHLIDIALRALSPGINDTNTALVVVDRLRGALARLLGKQLAIVVRHPQAWRVRFKQDSHEDVLDTAFNQIRQAATGNPAALIRLLQAQGRLAEHVQSAAQRDALLRHARMLVEAARAATVDGDRNDVEQAWRAVEAKLRACWPAPALPPGSEADGRHAAGSETSGAAAAGDAEAQQRRRKMPA